MEFNNLSVRPIPFFFIQIKKAQTGETDWLRELYNVASKAAINKYTWLTPQDSNDQVEKKEIWGHVILGRGEVHTGFCWGNLLESDHLEDPGIDGRIILNRSSRSGMGWDGVDWSGLE